MRVNDWLIEAQHSFRDADIDTARLDALVLLEDVTGKDRAWLLAHPEHALSSAETTKLEKLLNRRTRHEPLAYIRGRGEFYGREFVLTPAVLQPRPESEAMIELLKALPMFNRPSRNDEKKSQKKAGSIRIADVGTGSGVLGITAKLELPPVEVDLLDVDPKALKVAKTNVDKFTLDVAVVESDLLASSRRDYDILLCNLPYVTDGYEINRAAMHEPRSALFGGPDGLDVYRRLFRQVPRLQKKPLYILTESLPSQHEQLASIARSSSYKLQQVDDFVQVLRKF